MYVIIVNWYLVIDYFNFRIQVVLPEFDVFLYKNLIHFRITDKLDDEILTCTDDNNIEFETTIKVDIKREPEDSEEGK